MQMQHLHGAHMDDNLIRKWANGCSVESPDFNVHRFDELVIIYGEGMRLNTLDAEWLKRP